jgi:hypothetical protein
LKPLRLITLTYKKEHNRYKGASPINNKISE